MSLQISPQLERAQSIDRDGFVTGSSIVPFDLVKRAISAVESAERGHDAVRSRRNATYAIRNALTIVPELREIARCPSLLDVLKPLIGDDAFVTRAILFDKNPAANWGVPWHQDTTIAVLERRDVPGFGPWSVKAGVVHVQPPATMLDRVLTVRVHLDDCDATNGALQVLPGSHRHGLLDESAVCRLRESVDPVTCEVQAGGAVLMRPLILHASFPATSPRHRRVLHLEFATGDLPGGLRWHRGGFDQ